MATSFYFSVRPAWVLAAAGRTSYQRCYHAADQMLLRSLACTNTQTGEYTMLIKSVCFSFKLEQQWCVHGLVIVWWLVYIIVTTEKLISVHCKWYISYSQCLLFIAGMFSKFTSSPWLCIYKVFTENIPFSLQYVDLYSALSWSTTSNALPFPVSRRWSPQANRVIWQTDGK